MTPSTFIPHGFDYSAAIRDYLATVRNYSAESTRQDWYLLEQQKLLLLDFCSYVKKEQQKVMKKAPQQPLEGPLPPLAHVPPPPPPTIPFAPFPIEISPKVPKNEIWFIQGPSDEYGNAQIVHKIVNLGVESPLPLPVHLL